MKQNETSLVQKGSVKFHCELCDYSTIRKSQYERHLSTDKHKMKQNGTFETSLVQKSSENLQCICGICFNSRTTLWRHKKVCKSEKQFDEVENKSLKNIFERLCSGENIKIVHNFPWYWKMMTTHPQKQIVKVLE